MKTQGALYAVRDPPTLFAATIKTQGALYVVRDPSTLFAANYENSGSTLRGQGSSYPLLAATMKTQGAFYAVRDPPTHSSQQLWKLREHSTQSGILLHSSQQLWKLREHSTRVRDPPTLFAAITKTQGALYAGQGSSYTLRSDYETQGALYAGQGSSYTLRSDYENSGSTLCRSGILLHSSQQLGKLREHSTRVWDPPTLFAVTTKAQGALYAVRDPSTLFQGTMKTQGALYVVRDPSTLFAATMKTHESSLIPWKNNVKEFSTQSGNDLQDLSKLQWVSEQSPHHRLNLESYL
jgi:hypothetical protein